jgi:hypothetical protein
MGLNQRGKTALHEPFDKLVSHSSAAWIMNFRKDRDIFHLTAL